MGISVGIGPFRVYGRVFPRRRRRPRRRPVQRRRQPMTEAQIAATKAQTVAVAIVALYAYMGLGALLLFVFPPLGVGMLVPAGLVWLGLRTGRRIAAKRRAAVSAASALAATAQAAAEQEAGARMAALTAQDRAWLTEQGWTPPR